MNETAAVFWDKLPQYEGQSKSKIFTDWLESFEARYSIEKYKRYEEKKAVDLVVVEEELQKMRKRVQPYNNEDVYNMYESALF